MCMLFIVVGLGVGCYLLYRKEVNDNIEEQMVELQAEIQELRKDKGALESIRLISQRIAHSSSDKEASIRDYLTRASQHFKDGGYIINGDYLMHDKFETCKTKLQDVHNYITDFDSKIAELISALQSQIESLETELKNIQ